MFFGKNKKNPSHVALLCWSSDQLKQTRSSCCSCFRQHLQATMNCLDFILLALNFLSLKCPKCDAWTDSRFDQTALYSSAKDNPVVCYDDLVSVHLSKEQFSNLPLTIYIQGTGKWLTVSRCKWQNFEDHMLLLWFRWAWRILSSCSYCQSLPLLLWRNAHLCHPNGCLPWLFCEKTGELIFLQISFIIHHPSACLSWWMEWINSFCV